MTVETIRRHKNFILLTFEGYDNINQVEPFKNSLLKISKDQLEEDELKKMNIIILKLSAAKCYSEEGEHLGEITDILETGANDVWELKDEKGKKHYIPYIEDIVKEIDVDNKKITIHVMEGLLS